MFARTVRLLSKRVAPPPPRPFVASAPPPTPSSAESTLADSLMDSTASGIVMRTSIIFLSALAGAQLVHSVMQPDTSIPNLDEQIFERKRKLKAAEAALTQAR